VFIIKLGPEIVIVSNNPANYSTPNNRPVVITTTPTYTQTQLPVIIPSNPVTMTTTNTSVQRVNYTSPASSKTSQPDVFSNIYNIPKDSFQFAGSNSGSSTENKPGVVEIIKTPSFSKHPILVKVWIA